MKEVQPTGYIKSGIPAMFAFRNQLFFVSVMPTRTDTIGKITVEIHFKNKKSWIEVPYDNVLAIHNQNVTAFEFKITDTIISTNDMWELLNSYVDQLNVTRLKNIEN